MYEYTYTHIIRSRPPPDSQRSRGGPALRPARRSEAPPMRPTVARQLLHVRARVDLPSVSLPRICRVLGPASGQVLHVQGATCPKTTEPPPRAHRAGSLIIIKPYIC